MSLHIGILVPNGVIQATTNACGDSMLRLRGLGRDRKAAMTTLASISARYLETYTRTDGINQVGFVMENMDQYYPPIQL